MDNLRPPIDSVLLDPGTVTCSACGRILDEDEAQAQRWGYWSDRLGELYPFCPECAGRRHARLPAAS